MSLRAGKIALIVVMCGLALASLYVSTLTSERHDALRRVSRYNMTWLASQAGAEFIRLEERIAAVGIPGSNIDSDEVQLRLDIMLNRLQLLRHGEFEDFTKLDPDNVAIVALLADTLPKVQALVDKIDSPGSIAQALALLEPLDAKLAQLAAAANRFGGLRVAEDQRELLHLHNIFSIMVAGLLGTGMILVVLLGWHNKLLERTRSVLQQKTLVLKQTSDDLECAHAEVKSVNAQLQARNDILQRRDRELGMQNRRFDAALNNMSQALCMVDAAGRLVVNNGRFAAFFGLGFTPMPGMLFPDLIRLSGSAELAEIFEQQKALIGTGANTTFNKDFGERLHIAVSHQPMPDGGWVATYEDITERRQAEAKITYMAHHDGLTGLVNRRYFHEQVGPALARAERSGTQVAIMCLDLDGFKDVNDSLGHPVGDALLRLAGERLKANVREGDVVARLGGDEFAILQLEVASACETGAMADRLIECLSQPFSIDGVAVEISASIGIALGPLDGASFDDLLKNADLALYRVKADGGHMHRFFETDMDLERKARRALEADLRRALPQNEFQLYFQPIIDVGRNVVTAFEALIRWRHPSRGMVSPAQFIPVAEEIGLISEIGDWVLREACRTASTWPGQMSVAVNLSPAQFKKAGLVDKVRNTLRQTGLAAARLELEITENVLLNESDSTLATLHDLRALGIRIAMDDFGTGYSSLSYLRSFPFDKIKIDQSFVRELSTRPDCIKIVGSIAALGASLGMVTTAEGVETVEQFEQLRSIGCDQVQGYLFDRPQPADKLRFSVRDRLRRAAAA